MDTVKTKGYDNTSKKIYVAYLTRWGDKKVQEHSLSDELKKELGDRFLEINYYSHVLPWLEEVLLEVPLKEETLITGMKQYIDTLKGYFNLRKGEKEIMDKIAKILKERLKLEGKYDLENIEQKKKDFEECIKGLEHLGAEEGGKLSHERAKEIQKKLEGYNKKLFEVSFIKGGHPIDVERGFYLENCSLKIEEEELNLNLYIWINHEYYEKNYSYSIWISEHNNNQQLKKELELSQNYGKLFGYPHTEKVKKQFLDFLEEKLFPFMKKYKNKS